MQPLIRNGLRAVAAPLAVVGLLVIAGVGIHDAQALHDLARSAIELRRAAARLHDIGPDTTTIDAELDALDAIAGALDATPDRIFGRERTFVRALVTSGPARTYLQTLRRDFALPVHRRIEDELRAGGGGWYAQRTLLAVYVMLGAPEHLDPLAYAEISPRWSRLATARASSRAEQIEWRALRHVSRWLDALKRGEEAPLLLDANLVAQKRAALERVPLRERLQSYLVDSLRDLRDGVYQPELPRPLDTPPLTIDSLFDNRAFARRFVTSRRALRGEASAQVEGIYTSAGQCLVFFRASRIEQDFLGRDWLLPSVPERQRAEIEATVRRVYDDYAERQSAQWTALLEDIVIRPPATVCDAREALERSLESIPPTELPHTVIHDAIEQVTAWPPRAAFDTGYGVDWAKVTGRASHPLAAARERTEESFSIWMNAVRQLARGHDDACP